MSFQRIEDVFTAFEKQKVLIIGDVMIDSYLWGEVNRISPEAPVPVVSVKKREKRLGGAANVAVNIQALGAEPILCAVIGKDQDGLDFLDLLQDQGLSSEGILQSESRVTTIKHRILSGHQHMLRVDSEITSLINSEDREKLLGRISALLPACSVVIFEDYDKGVIDAALIQKVIQLAASQGIPTVVDPKKRNFLNYIGASLFKPNLKELREGLKMDLVRADEAELAAAVQVLREQVKIQEALITLSEKGVYINNGRESFLIPAHVRSIADVSGAGDTVISVAALCKAVHMSSKFTAALANLAGGLVCEYVGVVSIDRDRLLQEAIQNKIFNHEYSQDH